MVKPKKKRPSDSNMLAKSILNDVIALSEKPARKRKASKRKK